MTSNVIETALQRVEITKSRIELSKGKGQSFHNEINVVDVNAKHVALRCITPMIIVDSRTLNPLMIVPREEDEGARTAVLIKERAKEKAKAKVLIETTANL
jgi:hypothetical protein